MIAELTAQTQTSSRNTSAKSNGASKSAKTRTFRRKKLEADFLTFCQLCTETDDQPISSQEFGALSEQANDFIMSSEFADGKSETIILGDLLLNECTPEKPRRSSRAVSLPPHLAGLCEAQLLAPEQERELFQRMNYLRFRAAKILDKHDHVSATQWDLERARGLLRAAEWYRDCIVQSNVRLVISIVKKFVNQQCGFDDLLSDGIMALIRSVDKFDYQLGFRFSTYATQVVRRNSYRFVMDRQDERLKITNTIGEGGVDVAEDDGVSSMDEAKWTQLRELLGMYLDRLDKREKFIIRARFSLGSHRRVQTLQRLADKLGISKERVRQLEKRAMEKLASMASEELPTMSMAS